eukprot:SAG31_NODE_1201_length_9418_cov_3.410881_6_plen_66_part_00
MPSKGRETHPMSSITANVMALTEAPSPYAMNSSVMIRVSQCEPRDDSPSGFSPISGRAANAEQLK